MANITKRNDSYVIRVSCGYDSTGKQIRRNMTWTPPPNMTEKQIQKELERQSVLFEEKCRNGVIMSGAVKLSEFVEKWFADYAEKQLAPKTLLRYRDFVKRINPALGHLRIDRIQPHHLIEFMNQLSEEGSREDIRFHSIADLKAMRESRSLSKTKAAGEIGISFSTLEAAETGNNILLENAEKISQYYSAPLSKVFEASNSKKGLSNRTILSHYRFLSDLFNTAVKWGIISSNPAQRVDAPKQEHKEAKYLDEEQAKELLRLIQNAPTQYRMMIIMLLFTGMRIGELCGLEWKDIDFQKEMICIRRSSQYLPGKGIFTKEPKNTSSIRTNKFSHSLFVELKSYKAWQAKERMKLGDQWIDCDRLFTQWNGAPIYPYSLGQWLNDFIKTTDLPHISVHSLRHTNATLMISSGTDIRTVSSRLGHSQTSTTMNIYAHAIRSKDEMAADAMEVVLSLDNQPKAN